MTFRPRQKTLRFPTLPKSLIFTPVNTTQYLRQLRRLDRDWQAAAKTLRDVRALGESLPEPPDLSTLEAAEAAARDRYDAHAALHPSLSVEFSARAELDAAILEERRLARSLELLQTAALPVPNDAHVAETAERVAGRQLALSKLVAEASALDATYQKAMARSDWFEASTLSGQAETLRARIAKSETALSRAENVHRDAVARAQAAEASAGRRATEIALASADLVRHRAYVASLRANIPETVAAPLREPRRRRYGEPAPAALHGLIRSRYRYEPATDTLRHASTGDIVRAPQSVRVDGHRIPRAAVVALLYTDTLTPEQLA